MYNNIVTSATAVIVVVVRLACTAVKLLRMEFIKGRQAHPSRCWRLLTTGHAILGQPRLCHIYLELNRFCMGITAGRVSFASGKCARHNINMHASLVYGGLRLELTKSS